MQLYQLLFPNGKKYIGITSRTAEERFKQHCEPSANKNPCQYAIHKYGKENVVLMILATVDNWELLCLAEQEAIEKRNTLVSNGKGYNVTLGGDGALKVTEQGEARIARDKAKKKIYYLSNAAVITARNKSYYYSNKIAHLTRQKAYNKANKSSLSVKKKAYYEANKVLIVEKQKAYYSNNKEATAIRQKSYCEKNKAVIAVKDKAYRQRKKTLKTTQNDIFTMFS